MTDEQPTADANLPTLAPMDQVLAMLEAMQEVSAQSSEQIEANILAGYLNAESLADLLDVGTTVKAEDVVGKPIVVTAVHYNTSKIVDGPPVYAVITAKGDGKPLTVTCGSRNVMTQLFAANAKGWLPFECVLDELPHPTANGFYPMYLRAVLPGDENAWAPDPKGKGRKRSATPETGEEPF